MAQTKLITDLASLVTPNNDDVFVIVDNTTNPSLSVTKQISYANLKESLQDMIDLLVSGDTSVSAVYDDASNTLTLSVVADTTVQKSIVSSGGTNIGSRQELNFIAGSGITISGIDNAGSNRIDLTVQAKPSDISINDLNTSSPLAVTLGGTAATTAAGARTSLGAAKAGANSDITSLAGLTTPLSVSQGGIGADTALQGLKNLAGLKYITNVGVAGESLIVNDTTLVSNEYRGELKGVKAGSSKVTVGTDGNDISVDVSPDDILNGASQNVDLNGFRITNIATPVGSNDAATRAYVDQVSAGLTVKESVLFATTSNVAASYAGSPNFELTITGTGVPSIDGESITAIGTRVLIKDQTTGSQNGIYTLSTAAASGVSAVFTRADDSNSDAEVIAGSFVFVQSGVTNGGRQFVQATSSPTLDSDTLFYTILNDATIPDGSVTNGKLAEMPAGTIKGAVTSGIPHDLTANQVISIISGGTSLLPATVLASGSTASPGIVQLYDNIDSASTSLAATANAVKIAADVADAAMPKTGGVFTGAVSGLTAPVGNNTTQLATTAFVNSEIANDAPTKTGGGASGTWGISISGNAVTASTLATGRTIALAGDLSGSVVFNGGSNVTITGVVADDSHNHVVSNVDGLQAALDAKAPIINAALSGAPTAPTAPSGNASTLIANTQFVATAISGVQSASVASADKLTTPRTINTVLFDGTGNIVVEPYIEDDEATNANRYLVFVDNSTAGHKRLNEDSSLTYNPSSNTLTASVFNGNLTGNATSATSASSATEAASLSTARTIALDGALAGSASFDGSVDATITASIVDNAVTNAKLADMSALRLKGAVDAGSPQDLTANQTIGILNGGTTKLTATVLPGGTTSASGIVQLYDNVDSVSASAAATANAVKIAYDAAVTASGVAAAAMPKAGGTFTGEVAFATSQAYPKIPQNSKTSSYTLIASDAGKHVSITSGGITIPSGIFGVGDAISIYNDSASNQTITQGSGVTLRQAGSANTGDRTLAQYGLATVLCVASNTFAIGGVGLS